MAAHSSTPAWFLFALLVLAGFVGAYEFPNGPLLAWWLGTALVFGGWFAFSGGPTPLRIRIERLVALHCVLIAASLFTTQMAARRLTSATHLRFNGVLVEQADSLVIASGMQGVDVVLPTISATQIPWSIRLQRKDASWYMRQAADVEQVRISPLPQSRLGKRYTVLNAVVLAKPGDSLRVRDERGLTTDVLTMRLDSGVVVLQSRRYGRYSTSPTNSRLRSRFARILRNGTAIGALDGQRTATAPYDRFVRVQAVAASDEVNGSTSGTAARISGLFDAAPRLLVSSAAPFIIDDFGDTTRGEQIRLPDSAQVEIRHMGGLWRFDIVAMQREATASRGIALRFGRNPRPLDTPLPSGDSCTPGAACGLLSLRRLPMPIAHVSLDAAGFDPTRFALLARVRETENGVTIVLPNDSIAVPLASRSARAFTMVPVNNVDAQDGGAALPAARATNGPRHWLMMSASSHHTDGAGRVLQVCLGVALLLLLTYRLIDRLTRSQLATHISNERAIALGLNALLTLLLARLIIGARVTFFPPFNVAGLNTAIGMWVAVAIVTTGLLSWNRWAPAILKFAHTLALHRNARGGSAMTVVRATLARGGGGAPQAVAVSAVLLLFPIMLLSLVAYEPVILGAVAGIAVLLTWFLIAWVIAFSGPTFHSFESGPFEVIEFHAAGDDTLTPRGRFAGMRALPERQLLFVCLLWTLLLLSARLVIVAAALPTIIALLNRRTSPADATPALPDRASLLMLVVGETLSVILIAALRGASENGAMAAFLFIILVTLVSVRSGRALAARMSRQRERTAVEGWTIALYLIVPLILLIPLAFIDMGLLLVMSIPIGGAAMLAVGVHRLNMTGRASAAVVASGLLYLLFFKVLFPDVSAFRSDDPRVRAARFEQMQQVMGIRPPAAVGESLERAAARAVATRDQDAAERLLITAAPGAGRDLLLPSIEQVWATRAYSASGAFGSGLGLAPIGGRGIAESVSYAENSYSVYILHEHGWVGGLAVLSTYLVFGVAVLLSVRKAAVIRTESIRATVALFLVATLIVIVPAVYVALSNLGVVPITGQNMPFLGLNAWSDVTLVAGVIGILITGAIRTEGIRG